MSLIKSIGQGLQKKWSGVVAKLDSLKGTPEEISKGFATGVAMSFTPMVGFHLLICLGVSRLTGQNGVAAALGTLAGNPWTFPLIWFATLHLGVIIMGADAPVRLPEFKMLFSEMFHSIIALDFKAFIRDVWPVFLPMLELVSSTRSQPLCVSALRLLPSSVMLRRWLARMHVVLVCTKVKATPAV